MQHKHEPMRIRDKSSAKKQGTLKIWMSFFEIRFCRRYFVVFIGTLQWHHNGNGRGGVSNHQLLDCALNHLFRRISNRTPNLRATGLCEGNSPVTGEFPAPKASNAEKSFHLMTSSWIWCRANLSIVLLRRSWDCPRVSETTLKNRGKLVN